MKEWCRSNVPWLLPHFPWKEEEKELLHLSGESRRGGFKTFKHWNFQEKVEGMVAEKHFQDKPIVNSGRMSEQKLTLCIGNKIINSFANDLRLISISALNLVFKTTSNINKTNFQTYSMILFQQLHNTGVHFLKS